LFLEFCEAKLRTWIPLPSGLPEVLLRSFTSGGARSPKVAIGRVSGGTPGKPGFLRSKKCAQIFLKKPSISVRSFQVEAL
jgi:hypothetical protein